MAHTYSDDEVQRYFGNPAARRAAQRTSGDVGARPPSEGHGDGASPGSEAPRTKREDARRLLRGVGIGLGLSLIHI